MIDPMIQDTDQYDILIVDDTPDSLELLNRILEERGYLVRAATNGPHALKAVESRLPDLILLDVKMPEMDGYEVCRRLKANDRSCNVPVIFISAYGETAEKVHGFKVGAVDFITKPYEEQEVLARVQTHLHLREMTESLEQKVNQRTAELTLANRQLRQQILDRERAQEALSREAEINLAAAELSRELLSPASIDDISSLVLEQAKRLTGSAFGFVGHIDPKTGYLVVPTLTRGIWDTCKVTEKDILFKKFEGLWGWVLENRKPLMTNAAVDDPRSSGIPPGHIPIHRFLSAPALINETLVGQVAVANPDRDYAERDIQMIERLANLYAIAIQRRQVEHELKKHRETLIKAERLSAVGEMASGVAHNFNNLLQMIMAGAEAAMTKLESGKIRGCLEAVQNIINASQRGADVVHRIKDFTLVTPDGMDEGTVFDLEELVDEAVELTKPLWKPLSSSRKYRLTYLKMSACHIKGKSSEIYEVVVNLIKNALEAMPAGGELTLETWSQEDTVFLRITDTGQGIPEEYFQRIFEPFFTTKGIQSSGLGLSSCYGIVKKHQGEIHVDSTLGQGTEFVINFPKSKPLAVEEFTSVSTINNHCAIRFLLIDDEINILKAVEMYFEDSEIDVSTASTAREGIQSVEKDRFDVILCDFGMDGMNGLEVGKWVQDHCRQQGIPKIPFLLYTGLDKELDAVKLKDSGIDRVVHKPTSCEDLLHIIREVAAPLTIC